MLNTANEQCVLATECRRPVLLGCMGIALVAAGAMANLAVLWLIGSVLMVAAGATMPRRAATSAKRIPESAPEERNPARRPKPACSVAEAFDGDDMEGLVEQMLAQNRHALLLRPQITANLTEAQFSRAVDALQTKMALVPDGEVTLGPVDDGSDDEIDDSRSPRAPKTHDVSVKRFFLDRYPVTNREFFEFVAAGGYRQASLWDETILPAVLDFVDRSGEPGPYYWKEGCFLEGTEDNPVVGVCWHEAMAYARWVGKRLPSDAEWVKAGAWPVPMANNQRLQRKYPWGDDMDRTRANLWESGPGHIVSVRDFADGVSVGGVYQLIGNVWEWINAPFHGGGHPLGKLKFKIPMKAIRGGAYDTYFDTQATCQFQSGDSALARKRNIGFRLAIGVCDLVLDYPKVIDAIEDSMGDSLAIQSGGGEIDKEPLPATDKEPLPATDKANDIQQGTKYETKGLADETLGQEVRA